jgi:hypothetical protein
MAEEPRSRPRSRWHSRLALVVLCGALFLVGLAPTGIPRISFTWFRPVEGFSEDDIRLFAEIKALGGEARFVDRKPRFLGYDRGRDSLSVGFHGRPISDERLVLFIRRYGDRIVDLDLSNTGLTDEHLRHLAGLKQLRQLRIGHFDTRDTSRKRVPRNSVTDRGLAHLKGLTSLGGLDISGLPVTDGGLEAIDDLPNLGALYLDRTLVRGPALSRLKSLPGIAVLYCDGSALTDEGLEHLKGANNLQLLSLVGVPLSGRGLAALKTLPKLNQLNVKKCGLGFEDLDDFRAARPTVKLE